MLSSKEELIIEQQFDSFCKKVLREEARDYLRSIQRLSAHELYLEDLSDRQLGKLQRIDDYPSDYVSFCVQGQVVMIHNDRLAEAIASLTEEKRRIVLLAYFADLSDREVAERMKLTRSTVQYKRTRALEEMKKNMEGTSESG